MEEIIKKLLINAARDNKPITYSEIATQVGLNLEDIKDRNILSELLGGISEKEHHADRPLISSMAMHSDLQSHGDGFYNLCAKLGLGNKQKLKDELYAFKAMKESHEYWKDKVISIQRKHPIEIFTSEDLTFFNSIHLGDKKVKNSSNATIDRVKKLFKKTNYWAQKTAEGLLYYKEDNHWQVSGSLKGYSWAKLFGNKEKDKEIFFTLGIGSDLSLFYKLDCARSESLAKHLSAKQIERFDYLLKGTGASWVTIKPEALKDLDWDALIKISRNFIQKHLALYYDAIEYVWNEPQKENIEISFLTKTSAPKATTTSKETTPAFKKNLNFQNIDYVSEHETNTKIGNLGETIVIRFEQEKLKKLGLHDLAAEVRKMPDGSGYDILSYSEEKTELYIEVKTTVRNKEQPFFISSNEMEFLEEKANQSLIYRLYNLKPIEETACFFVLTWEELQKYNRKPTEFKISI